MFVGGNGSRLIERDLLAIFSLSLFLLLVASVHAKVEVIRENSATTEGEKAGKSTFAKEIESDLRQLSGIGTIEIDENGILRSGPGPVPESGSETFREFFLALMKDRKRTFVIEERHASPEVHFAYADAGTVDLETGNVFYRIFVDPADFRSAQRLSGKAAVSSFSIGIVLFHEISHKVSYSADEPIPAGGVRPDVGRPGVAGAIELTNRVRAELGLSMRKPGRHLGELYRGPVRAFRHTCSIEFEDSAGKEILLRWKY